jgi:hypothetical protein
MDLAVATGMGITAGLLIGSGVGASAGIGMLGGIGMGTALLADHTSNIVTKTDFSRSEHIEEGGIGLVTGATTALLPAGTPAIIKGMTAVSSVGGYKVMKHHLHPELYPDDPSGDLLDMLGAGFSEVFITRSKVFDIAVSMSVDTSIEVYKKTKKTPNILKFSTPRKQIRRIQPDCKGRLCVE